MNMLGFRATGEQQGKSTVAIQQSLPDVKVVIDQTGNRRSEDGEVERAPDVLL